MDWRKMMKKLNNYDEYLLDLIVENVSTNEAPLILSDRLKTILEQISHPIAYELLKSQNDRDKLYKFTYVDLDDKNLSSVSYIMVNKASEIIKNFYQSDTVFYNIDNYKLLQELYSKNRTVTSIGKMINKLYPNKFEVSGKPDSDIQSFVDMFKSERSVEDDFELVSGKDIVYWYYYENYYNQTGTLGNSCMRYNHCKDYIQFYADNPSKVSMLILKKKVNDEYKIKGRSLVWKLSEPSGRTFMDRIYTNFSYEEELFKKYAKEKGWLYKSHQDSDPDDVIIDPVNNINGTRILIVNDIKESSTDKYPYVDTLVYFDINNSKLTNSSDVISNNYYYMRSTDGDVEQDSGPIYVPFYNDYFYEDDLIYCELGDEYRLPEDVIHVKYLDENATERWINNHAVYSSYEDDYILDDDAVWSEFHGDYLFEDKLVYILDSEGAELDNYEELEDIDTDPRDKNKDDTYFEYIAPNDTKYYFDNKDFDDNFVNAERVKHGENKICHLKWDKDKLFKYKNKLYYNDSETYKDYLIGQTRLWDK